jgi:hypothetical protein
MSMLGTLRERMRRIAADRWRRRLLTAWLVFGVFELVASAGCIRRPSLTDAVIELLALGCIGVLHAACAADDWRSSAMWPAALGTALIAARQLDEIVVLAHESIRVSVPLMAAGLLLFAIIGTRSLDKLLWRRLPATLLAAAPPLLMHMFVVGAAQTVAPFLPETTRRADGPRVVVITVDALRADAARRMQSFQRLAERGAYWERASAASSWTLPSLVSLWSGVDAPTHGAGRKNEMHLALRAWDAHLPMLPAELQARGYRTAAFVGNDMLALMPFDRMFDHWRLGNTVNVPLAVAGFPHASSNGADAADIVDAAVQWIDRAPTAGWLSWVHLYEPHLPYRHARNPELNYNLVRNTRSGEWLIGPREQREVRAAYLDEVAYADRQLMRLIDALERHGILDRGIVVLTADHGEELWEHGGFEHGHSHHGEVTDVPLVLVGPGVTPARRTDVAALEDIAPTIRRMLGIPTAHAVDLRAPISDARMVHLGGNFYHAPMQSYRWGHERLIVEGQRAQAYDLALDPGEQHPLENSDKVRNVLAAGGADGSHSKRAGAPHMTVDLQPLRALGYVN